MNLRLYLTLSVVFFALYCSPGMGKTDIEAPPLNRTIVALEEAPISCEGGVADGAMELTEVLFKAVCESALVKRNDAAAVSATAERGKARAPYYPTVSAAVSGSSFEKAVTYPNFSAGNYSLSGQSGLAEVSVNWLLFDFGKRSANLVAAENLVLSALAERQKSARDVILLASEAFYRLQAAELGLSAALDAERNAQESADYAEALRKYGAGGISDRLLAENSRNQARLRRIDAASERELARGDLARILGRPSSDVISIASPIMESNFSTMSTGENLSVLMDNAVFRSPRLISLARQVNIAEARLEAAKAELLPSISMSGSAYKSLTPQAESVMTQSVRGWSIGLQARIPIFDGLLQRSNIDSIRAEVDIKRMELAEATHDVQSSLWTNLEGLRRETDKFSLAQTIVRTSAEAYGAARVRYKAGVGPLLELLRAQSDEAEARRQSIESFRRWQVERVKFVVNFGSDS